MKRRLVIAPEAEIELNELATFMSEDSLDAALRFYEATESAFQRLLALPEIGAPRDLDSPRLSGLRMWPIPDFPNHLIFYRPTKGGIEIIRVLHASRDIPGVLEDK